MESRRPSATFLNAPLQGSHYPLPEGVRFGADSLETWFNSGCVTLLGPLPSLGLFIFIFSNCQRGWGCHFKLPFRWAGCSASCRQGLRGSGTEIPSPRLSSRPGSRSGPAQMPAQFSGRRLITRRRYPLIAQTSYLGRKHLGKHIRPNRPGLWDPEPLDKHLGAAFCRGRGSPTLPSACQ